MSQTPPQRPPRRRSTASGGVLPTVPPPRIHSVSPQPPSSSSSPSPPPSSTTSLNSSSSSSLQPPQAVYRGAPSPNPHSPLHPRSSSPLPPIPSSSSHPPSSSSEPITLSIDDPTSPKGKDSSLQTKSAFKSTSTSSLNGMIKQPFQPASSEPSVSPVSFLVDGSPRQKKQPRMMDGSVRASMRTPKSNVEDIFSNSSNSSSGKTGTVGRKKFRASVRLTVMDPEVDPVDSLQLFSLTLDIIKEIIHHSRSLLNSIRRPEEEPEIRQQQQKRANQAIEDLPGKVDLMGHYVSLIVSSIGCGVSITLACKDFESAVKTSLLHAKEYQSAGGEGGSVSVSVKTLDNDWGKVTASSTAFLGVLKERKFLLDKDSEDLSTSPPGGSGHPTAISPDPQKEKDKRKSRRNILSNRLSFFSGEGGGKGGDDKGGSSLKPSKKKFEISDPKLKATTAVTLDQAPYNERSQQTNHDSKPISVGLAPKPNKKMFDRFEDYIGPLAELVPSSQNLDALESLVTSLQRHFHAVSRSVAGHNPDASFILDEVKKGLDEFIESSKACLSAPSDNELLQQKTDLLASLRDSLELLLASSCQKGSKNVGLEKFEELAKERRKAIGEIISTEKSYLTQLNELENFFMKPIQATFESETPLATKKDFEAMFGTIGIIFKIVQDHYPEMEQAAAQKSQPIGATFLKMCPWLKHYAVYINSFDESAKVIQLMRKKNSALNKFFKDGTKKSPMNYDLSSYLILPVQRLGRYELLLKRVTECTPELHPDTKDLKNALSSVVAVNQQINSFIKADENRLKIDEISKKFTTPPKPPLYSDGRLLVREGKVTWLSKGEKNSSKTKPFYCILFDDMVVVCKITKEEKYEKKNQIVFTEDCKVLDAETSAEKAAETAVLVAGGVVHYLIFESKLKKKQWMQSLREILSAVSVSVSLRDG